MVSMLPDFLTYGSSLQLGQTFDRRVEKFNEKNFYNREIRNENCFNCRASKLNPSFMYNAFGNDF